MGLGYKGFMNYTLLIQMKTRLKRFFIIALSSILGLVLLICTPFILVQLFKETKVYPTGYRYLYEFQYKNVKDTIAYDLAGGFYPSFYQYGGFYVRKPKLSYEEFIEEKEIFEFDGTQRNSDPSSKYTYYVENRQEATGILEDSELIFMHPPREMFGSRTELAPFPKWYKRRNENYSITLYPTGFSAIDELDISEIKSNYKERSQDSIFTGNGWYNINCKVIESYSVSDLGDTLAFANFLVNDSLGLISSETLFKGDSTANLKLNYLGKEERKVPNVVLYTTKHIFLALFEMLKSWFVKTF